MAVPYHTHTFEIPVASDAETAAGVISNKVVVPSNLGTAAVEDATSFATAAQGTLADSAVQPADLSAVATSGDYDDLTDKPTLGTAAAADATDFATASQGALADTAMQEATYDPGNKASNAFDSDNQDFLNSGTGAAVRSVQERLRDTVSVLDFGTVDLTGVASAQTVAAAAVLAAFTDDQELFWPAGTYLTTASIPNFHGVKHHGPGVVKRISLGTEIITNGDFASGASWNVSGTGVSITAGVGRFAAATGYLFYQNFSALTAGKTYRATFTISNRSSGSIRLRFGVGSTIYESTGFASANGTFSFDVTVSQPVTRVYIDAGTTPTFDIDNISVKEVIPDLWYITPAEYGTINHVYAAASGGSAANDGLSSSQPIDTFQHAIDAITAWAPLNRGEWQIDLAAGTYARGRFQDAGVPSAYPIIIAGPPVSITAGAAFKMSITGRSGSFTNGETITFSTSGATATLTFVDNTKNVLFATLVSGTPVVGQTITGGTSAATATMDYQSPTPLAKIKEGATQSGVGILGFYTSFRAKDIEIEDYNGSTSSNGVRVDFRDSYLENVHIIDCYYGASVFNRGKLDVKGGFAYDNGYLNSSTGGGFAYRLIFHGKAEIGTQNAGNLASGPAIKGCSGTVRMQELSTGHLDYVLQHDNDAGARLLVNSRLNIDGSSFKRIGNSAIYCTQGSYADTTSNTVFGTGADTNTSDISIGSNSNSSSVAIDTINTANATEWRTFKSAFPGTVVTSTSSANTIDSFTLKGGIWNNTILSGIAAKKVKLDVWGVLTGSTGTYKRLQYRLGASLGFLPFINTDVGEYFASLELIFTGVNTQQMLLKGNVQIAGAATVSRFDLVTLTESMASDGLLSFQAYVQNAADSITINGYEWSELGV